MKVKKAKVVKASKKPKKVKKKKSLNAIILNTVAETLQANSDGEFELPSILTRYTEKSHPKYRLGLHRESYLPSHDVPFHDSSSDRAMMIFRSQASLIATEMLSGGIPVREKKFKMILCKDCK